jgi:HNH endonuclease
MATNKDLNSIYDRTDGACHICDKKLSFKNYGVSGTHGAWEIDHSVPRASGGTNHRSNLFAACIRCNRSKGSDSTRAARSQHGRSAAPLSKAKKAELREENALVGALTAGLFALLLGGSGPTALVIAGLGAWIEHKEEPDKQRA